MATRFVTNLDLNRNQVLNGRFQAVSADPSEGLFEGWVIYRTDLDCLKYCDGTSWLTIVKSVASGGTYATALSVSESGGAITITPNLADSANAGLLSTGFYTDLNNATASSTGGTLAKRDVDGRIQVGAPVNDLDAANKAYVDAARSGLDVKASVRATTTAVLPSYTVTNNVLDASADGALTVDGVALVVGDRVLVKNETAGNAAYNGIYVVTELGGESDPWKLTRAEDANSNAEVTAGMFTFVEEGTVNADSGWVLTTNNPIVLNTTNLEFVQFSGAGQITAGDGLVKFGNTIDAVGTTDRITVNADSIDIASTYVGQTSITTLGTIGTGTWAATDVEIAHGGTNASTESGARENLAAGGTQGTGVSVPVLARKTSKAVGDGAATSFTIQHGFGTQDVEVHIYEAATGEMVIADVSRTDENNVVIGFSVAPTNNQFRVVILG
jgi:hypothetical protein